LEFGQPITINSTLLSKYRTNKRDACNELLETVEKKLRSVTMNFPDFKSMQVVMAVRRLYQPEGYGMTTEQYLKLNRRFVEGYTKLRDRVEVKQLEEKVSEYADMLKRYGLKDYQVDQIELDESKTWLLACFRVIYLVALLMASLPGFIVNVPIAGFAKYLSQKEAVKAKKNSDVKLYGLDVVASYKVLVAFILFPIVYSFYGIFLAIIFGWLLSIMILPMLVFFSYASLRIMEEGYSVWHSSVPLLLSLTITLYRERIYELRSLRHNLQEIIRKNVEILGPMMGEEFWSQRVIPASELKIEDQHRQKTGSLSKLKLPRHQYKQEKYDPLKHVLDGYQEELGPADS